MDNIQLFTESCLKKLALFRQLGRAAVGAAASLVDDHKYTTPTALRNATTVSKDLVGHAGRKLDIKYPNAGNKVRTVGSRLKAVGGVVERAADRKIASIKDKVSNAAKPVKNLMTTGKNVITTGFANPPKPKV